MRKNTVKPGLTRLRSKRAKRIVENPEYASFVGRILRSYARRVAAGDVEALRQLILLPVEVDTLTRTAVTGLREIGYSWAEIGDRLGVSRQAAQMRYGTAVERGALDPRVTSAGMGVKLRTLVAVFADHCRGIPAATQCAGCGYQFASDDTLGDCPTNRVVRPLLARRRHENMAALAPLSVVQLAELDAKPAPGKATRTTGRTSGRVTSSTAAAVVAESGLFDLAPYTRKAGLR